MDSNCVTDAWDRKPLLRGCWRKQGACAAEQDLFELLPAQPVKKIAAERHCAASAAGTAAVNILHCVIEYQGAAVCELSAQ